MAVFEITMKETKSGTQIRFRERRGRNSRGRWKIATFPSYAGMRSRGAWEAIRFAVTAILAESQAGKIPLTVRTRPTMKVDPPGLFEKV
jgi:hypothetical protein